MEIEQPGEVAQLREEIERLKGGLAWYAEGHHYDLPDWEDCSGESSNWIFPPTDDGWMVDDGGIAKAVLSGLWINPNHIDAEMITIGPISTEQEHETAMARISELMNDDPAAETPAGKELGLLAKYVEQYEIATIAKARTP